MSSYILNYFPQNPIGQRFIYQSEYGNENVNAANLQQINTNIPLDPNGIFVRAIQFPTSHLLAIVGANNKIWLLSTRNGVANIKYAQSGRLIVPIKDYQLIRFPGIDLPDFDQRIYQTIVNNIPRLQLDVSGAADLLNVKTQTAIPKYQMETNGINVYYKSDNRDYYDAETLIKTEEPIISSNNIIEINQNNIGQFVANPILLYGNSDWIVLMSGRNNILYEVNKSRLFNYQNIPNQTRIIRIPDIFSIRNIRIDQLPPRNLPNSILGDTHNIVDRIAILPSEHVNETAQSYQTNIVGLQEEYNMLLNAVQARITGGIVKAIITFDEATQLIQSGDIINFKIEPYLQIGAGKNDLATLFKKNGEIVFVRARYNKQTNELFPPDFY